MHRSDLCYIVIEEIIEHQAQEVEDELLVELRLRQPDGTLTVMEIDLWHARWIIPLRRSEIFAMRLWEDDFGPQHVGDEHLGTLAIKAADIGGFPEPDPRKRRHMMTGHGAKYEIQYRLVGPRQLLQALGQALKTSVQAERVFNGQNAVKLFVAEFDGYRVLDLSGRVVVGGAAA